MSPSDAATCQPISDNVPWHEYMDYYAPDYKLHVPVSNMENDNTPEQLEKTKVIIRRDIARDHARGIRRGIRRDQRLRYDCSGRGS